MRRLIMVMCLITLSACSSVNQPQAASVNVATAARPAPTEVAPEVTGVAPAVTRVAPSPTMVALTPTVDAYAQPVDAHGTVGQPVKNGGVTLTVVSTTLTSQIDQATPAGPGEAYLIADVLIENTGSDKVAYDVIYFSALDADYVESISSRVAPAPALQSGELLPGDKVRGYVAFKIKAAATGLNIKYQPVVMGRSPRIYIAVP
jgi:hypothetical protein